MVTVSLDQVKIDSKTFEKENVIIRRKVKDVHMVMPVVVVVVVVL